MCYRAFNKIIAMVSCLCLAMVICVTVVSAADETVVYTADFENTTPGELPTSWNGQGKVVQEKFYGGKASLYVEDTNTEDYMTVRTPVIALKPGTTYELSVMSCVSDIASGGEFAIFVREYDAEGKALIVHMLFIEKSATWAEFKQQFKISANATSVMICIYPACRGANYTASAWLDDLKLIEVQ